MNIFDKLYKGNKNIWWNDADEIIKLGLSYFKWNDILDLWVWDWRNSLFLISNWFYITWVDISNVWLNNLYEKLKNSNQEKFFQWIQADLNYYILEKKYNNIICNYLLHFLDFDRAISLLEQIKKNTEKWWINILSWFSLEWDLNLSTNKWVFDLNFFKDFYKGWEFLFIESVNEKVTEKTKDWGDKYHTTYNIIVKK